MMIAIVTGASSGLGRAFLEEWQKSGEHFDEVWLVARHESALELLTMHLPWRTRILATDLSTQEGRAVLFQALEEAQPKVKYLVNAAGYGKIGPVETIAPSEQIGMIDLNCTALVDVTQRVLPHMFRGSAIFEIASVAAFVPQPAFAVYAATKAFVLSFARALDVEEVRRGVRVVAVCPNPMATSFFDRAGTTPSLFKRPFFEAPEDVAHAAMRALGCGRTVVTNCRMATFIRLATKFLPHRLILGVQKLYFMVK